MRIGRVCGELALIAALCGAIVAVMFLGAVHLRYASTRYSVRATVSADGGVIFEHEDRETTEILNYLSGKEDLSREEKLAAVRSAFVNLIYQNDVPDNVDEMDEADLRLFCRRFMHCDTATEKNWLQTMPPPFYDEGLYKALWEIEKIAGNPKIRWGRNGPRRFNVYYHDRTNTIYLSPPMEGSLINAIHDFINEAAHGKQFNEKPFRSQLLWKRDLRIASYYAYVEKTTQVAAYDKYIYSWPGTLEYEAHKIIEPELKKILPAGYQK